MAEIKEGPKDIRCSQMLLGLGRVSSWESTSPPTSLFYHKNRWCRDWPEDCGCSVGVPASLPHRPPCSRLSPNSPLAVMSLCFLTSPSQRVSEFPVPSRLSLTPPSCRGLLPAHSRTGFSVCPTAAFSTAHTVPWVHTGSRLPQAHSNTQCNPGTCWQNCAMWLF